VLIGCDGRTETLRKFCNDGFQAAKQDLSALEERLTAKLDTLETRTTEVLRMARTNERRISLLIRHFGQEDGEQLAVTGQ
jgi:hypothetical protein